MYLKPLTGADNSIAWFSENPMPLCRLASRWSVIANFPGGGEMTNMIGKK